MSSCLAFVGSNFLSVFSSFHLSLIWFLASGELDATSDDVLLLFCFYIFFIVLRSVDKSIKVLYNPNNYQPKKKSPKPVADLGEGGRFFFMDLTPCRPLPTLCTI